MNYWVSLALEAYLIGINITSFLTFGSDKMRAIRDEQRIPEKTLFLLCILGGSLGGLIGMFLLHHKNRKKRFRFGIPVIFLIHALILLYFR